MPVLGMRGSVVRRRTVATGPAPALALDEALRLEGLLLQRRDGALFIARGKDRASLMAEQGVFGDLSLDGAGSVPTVGSAAAVLAGRHAPSGGGGGGGQITGAMSGATAHVGLGPWPSAAALAAARLLVCEAIEDVRMRRAACASFPSDRAPYAIDPPICPSFAQPPDAPTAGWDAIGLRRGLIELGLDSFDLSELAASLARRVPPSVASQLSAAALLATPNVGSLAQWIADATAAAMNPHLRQDEGRSTAETADPPGNTLCAPPCGEPDTERASQRAERAVRSEATQLMAGASCGQPLPPLVPQPPLASRRLAAHRLIGASALLPRGVGGLTDGKALWRLARLQADLVTEVPPTRWHLPPNLVAPAPPTHGRSTHTATHTAQAGREALRVRHGGFVLRAAMFDNAAFDVSPAEAAAMDPQQRLLLERGYDAFHAASLRRENLHGSAVGVHVGLASREFEAVTALAGGSGGRSAFLATASAPSVASGRLAFVLGLHGSAVTYDTACSSALVAAHGALLSRTAEAGGPAVVGGSPALVAAVHLMLLPATGAAYAIAGMTSIVGRCRTFDARADGYARAEACCAVTVGGPLAGAQGHAAGDPASTLRTSARLHAACVQQDGRSASLTAPNGGAQRSLLTATLSLAGLGGATSTGMSKNTPGDGRFGDGWFVSACEAHGTGTPLGDAVEASALAFGAFARAAIGGIKASAGHAEAAAGAAGLIQLCGLLTGRLAPTNAQLCLLNPHVAAALSAGGCCSTALCVQPAPLVPGPRRASPGGGHTTGTVSSFGYSGTIAAAAASATGNELTAAALLPRQPLRYHRRSFPWRVPTAAGGAGGAVQAGGASPRQRRLWRAAEAAVLARLCELRGAPGADAADLPLAPYLSGAEGRWGGGGGSDNDSLHNGGHGNDGAAGKTGHAGGDSTRAGWAPWKQAGLDVTKLDAALIHLSGVPTPPDLLGGGSTLRACATHVLRSLRPGLAACRAGAPQPHATDGGSGGDSSPSSDDAGSSSPILDGPVLCYGHAESWIHRAWHPLSPDIADLSSPAAYATSATSGATSGGASKTTTPLAPRAGAAGALPALPRPTVPSLLTPHRPPTSGALQVWGTSVLAPMSVRRLRQLWEMGATAGDAVGEVPPTRWTAADLAAESTDQRVLQRSRYGAFVTEAELFDASAWSMSVAEARVTDPQHRLLLERGYEALHAAGLRRDALLRSDTAVDVGIYCNDFSAALQGGRLYPGATRTAYAATGHSLSIASGRLSYALGMQGPCMAIETACSASLVALQVASQQVRSGLCHCISRFCITYAVGSLGPPPPVSCPNPIPTPHPRSFGWARPASRWRPGST